MPNPADPATRTMLALAAIAYRGYDFPSPDKQVQRFAAMTKLLDHCSATIGWKIVWGPCGLPPDRFGLDEELMYVAQSADDPPKLAIVIRGTNPLSLMDWIKGDFAVSQMTPWNFGKPPPGAAVSASTMRGLDTLRDLRDPLNGAKALKEFLREFLQQKPNSEVYVTGHSKGGLLSSTLALWLDNTRQAPDDPAEQWDPERRASVLAYSFAGPTAGNAAFANYSDYVLGANGHRVWNKRDVAPRAFIPKEMEEIPTLYELNLLERETLRLFINLVAQRVNGLGYRQISAGGTMFDRGARGLGDVVYEHLDSYLEQFGLINEMRTKTLFDL